MGLFRFRRFSVDDHGCGQKVCSDSVLFGAWFLSAHTEARTVLDVGSGSGVLALMGADLLPDAIISAVELDSEAADAARSNFEDSPWAQRLSIIHGDFREAANSNGYDLILSNPPFFGNGEHAEDPSRATARHEGSLNYASLQHFAAQNLQENGHLGLISPSDRENEIIFEGELAGLTLRRLCRVHTSSGKAPTRLLWDFSRKPGPQTIERLAIRDANGAYTAQYLSLVEDIYLTLK